MIFFFLKNSKANIFKEFIATASVTNVCSYCTKRMGVGLWGFPSLCCGAGALSDMKRSLASDAGESQRGQH